MQEQATAASARAAADKRSRPRRAEVCRVFRRSCVVVCGGCRWCCCCCSTGAGRLGAHVAHGKPGRVGRRETGTTSHRAHTDPPVRLRLALHRDWLCRLLGVDVSWRWGTARRRQWGTSPASQPRPAVPAQPPPPARPPASSTQYN